AEGDRPRLAGGPRPAVRRAQAPQPRAQGPEARPSRGEGGLPPDRLRGERRGRPGRLYGVRAQVDAPLPRGGPEPARERRRAAYFLPVPKEPGEAAADDERDRAAARGFPPARQDAGQSADRGGGARAALRPRGRRADSPAASRRLAPDPRRAARATPGRGM